MAFDRSKFIDSFKAETRDHIQKLNQGLLRLEKNLQDRTLLESLMREAHTIKGSAGMMGFKRIMEVAHGMESGLQKALEGKLSLEKKHFDVLFKCVDAIEPLLDDKIVWEDKGVARPYTEDLCKQTEEVFRGGPSGETAARDPGEVIREKTEMRTEALQAEMAGHENVPPKASADAPGEFPDSGLQGRAAAKRVADHEPRSASAVVEESIRVDIKKLDALVNLSGELLICKTRLDEVVKRFSSKVDSDRRSDDSLRAFSKALTEVDEEVNSLTSSIQAEVLSVRMVNVANLFNLFPRAMRDLAANKGKDAVIEIRGEDTQLDKAIIDELKDPVMHILRNAVDHGLETPEDRARAGKPKTGKLLLNAYQQGTQVVIEVSDDGGGIDVGRVKQQAVKKGLVSKERVEELVDEQVYQFLFVPGFSTRDEVTETSGRGVGLDVVREKIARLKGIVELVSRPGEGTKFIMKVPLTLAITECLVVSAGNELFAVPIDAVVETVRISLDDVRTVETKEAITVRGHIMPLVRLKDIFALPEKGIVERKHFPLIVVQSVEKKIGLLVEHLLGRQEIVRKNVGDPLKSVRDIAGATILGDGSIILILDIPSIIRSAEGVVVKRQQFEARPVAVKKRRKTILLAEDSLSTAMLEKNVLEAAGFSVVIARDGKEALEKAGQEKFDLVISDVLMPRMDGFELTAKLKQDNVYKNVPVIIVTTRESDADKRRGLEAGAEAYILKSEFTSEGLLETIERLIG